MKLFSKINGWSSFKISHLEESFLQITKKILFFADIESDLHYE